MYKLLLSVFFTLSCTLISAQTFDVGTLNDIHNREKQLKGKWDPQQSVMIRSLALMEDSTTARASFRKPIINILPISLITQYNSRHPYGGNDGSLIPAKGLQSRFSTGIQLKAGFIEAQFAPEVVGAVNQAYQVTPDFGYNNGKSFQRIYSGQSTIQLTQSGFKAGVSTANQWWGPGVRNSLLMSYQAPGFVHFFVGSKRPQSIGIGHLEWKMTGGWLEADGDRSMEHRHLRSADPMMSSRKRYVNAVTVSYQPKWVPGLFVGLSRVIQTYTSDSLVNSLGSFERYFPVLALGGQKKNLTNEDQFARDQVASFFLRWVLKEHQLEFYTEYGYNDYKTNIRDYIGGVTHSAAHIVGIQKRIDGPGANRYITLNMELTKVSQSPDWLVRSAGNWYEHDQIKEGYTNDNQIMGSVYGFGADAVFVGINFVKEENRLSFFYEQIVRDPIGRTLRWVDRSIGAQRQIKKGKWLLSGKLQMILSSNYTWRDGSPMQIQAGFGITRF